MRPPEQEVPPVLNLKHATEDAKSYHEICGESMKTWVSAACALLLESRLE